jgi:hypothetical protein
MNLQDFITLADAQAYTEIVDKKQVGSGQARGYFVNTGIWTKLKTIQSDITHPLFALADAVIVTASDASSYFGLDVATSEGQGNIAGAQILVDAGVMTAAERDGFLALATKTSKPFANSTQLQFNQAKQIYTEKEVVGWTQGKNVKLTLIDALPFDCTASSWGFSDVFGYENAGRLAHLKSSKTVYKIDLTGVKVDGKLMVRIPISSFDFAVEAI